MDEGIIKWTYKKSLLDYIETIGNNMMIISIWKQLGYKLKTDIEDKG